MDAIKRLVFSVQRVLLCMFVFVALLFLLTACAGQAPAAAPTPQVFDSPAQDIQTFTRYFKEGNHFGAAVDMEGNTVVVGAPWWVSPPGLGAGSVHVLHRTPSGELEMAATLTASDRDDGFQYDQHFGGAVAIQGNVIAIGAPGYDDRDAGDNTGAVYIFEHNGNGWVETDKLTSSNAVLGAKLGTTIAFDGDLLAASGSPMAESVTIFQKDAGGWREISQVPIPPSPDEEELYVLIDLYGGTLAVSTITYQAIEQDEDILDLIRYGIVTVYERTGDGWAQVYETPPQEASLFQIFSEGPFGLPIALGGEAGKANLLAVGKPGFTASEAMFFGSGAQEIPMNLRDAGSVAIFTRAERGWAQDIELMLSEDDAAPGALPFFGPNPGTIFFGGFVEAEVDRLAVYATFANAAYVFEKQGEEWVYTHRLAPVREGGGDDFQLRPLALSENRLLMGSSGELGGGEVYVFDLAP